MSKLKLLLITPIVFVFCLFFTACPPNEKEEVILEIGSIEHYELALDGFDYTLTPYYKIFNSQDELNKYISLDKYQNYINKYDNNFFSSNSVVFVTLLETSLPDKYDIYNPVDHPITNSVLVLTRSTYESSQFHKITIFIELNRGEKELQNITLSFNNSNVEEPTISNLTEEFINIIKRTNYKNYTKPRSTIFNLKDLYNIKCNQDLDNFVVMSISNMTYLHGNVYIKKDKLEILDNIYIDDVVDKNNNPAWMYFSGENSMFYKLQIALEQGLIEEEDILVDKHRSTYGFDYTSISNIYTKRYTIEDLDGNIIQSGNILYSAVYEVFSKDLYYFDEGLYLIYNDIEIDKVQILSELDIYNISKYHSFSCSRFRLEGRVRILYGTYYGDMDLKSKYTYSEYYDGNIDMKYHVFLYKDIYNLIKEKDGN